MRAYHHTYGLPVLTTNCSNNYGPFQLPDKLIPLTILNVLHGRPVSVYGNGQNVRDWLHVEDHCRALQLVLQHGQSGEVYNIGGNCERTNLDVVTTICEIVDALRPELPYGPSIGLLRFVPDRPGHDFRYAIDSNKIQRHLGWRPTIGFREGIERTIRWYQEHLDLVDSTSGDRSPASWPGLETRSPLAAISHSPGSPPTDPPPTDPPAMVPVATADVAPAPL